MGCRDKIICSAFQSTYILDDSTRNAFYSYVWQLDEVTRSEYLASLNNTASDSTDSTQTNVGSQNGTDYYAYAGEKVVPWRTKKRTKYGIVKYEPFWLTNYKLRTAPMENVHKPKRKEKSSFDPNYVATQYNDSTLVDSLGIASLDSLNQTLVATEEKEDETKYLYGYDPSDNFNVEQEYYNKYYASKFIDNRPKREPVNLTPTDSLGQAVLSDSLKKKKSPFKGLFKKKRNQPDSTSTAPVTDQEVEGDSGNE